MHTEHERRGTFYVRSHYKKSSKLRVEGIYSTESAALAARKRFEDAASDAERRGREVAVERFHVAERQSFWHGDDEGTA